MLFTIIMPNSHFSYFLCNMSLPEDHFTKNILSTMSSVEPFIISVHIRRNPRKLGNPESGRVKKCISKTSRIKSRGGLQKEQKFC